MTVIKYAHPSMFSIYCAACAPSCTNIAYEIVLTKRPIIRVTEVLVRAIQSSSTGAYTVVYLIVLVL